MKEYTTQCGMTIPYSWIRRQRKTAELRIDPTEGLMAIVPRQWTQKNVEQLLEKKKRWILKKFQLINNQATPISPLVFDRDGQLLFKGQWYPMRVDIRTHGEPQLHFCGDAFRLVKLPDSKDDELKEVLINWFKHQAQQLLVEKVSLHAPNVAGMPTQVRAKEQKKRWGSCTYDNKLLFNWRLALAPSFIVDAVVLHELCHMVHKNHSKDFWDLVRSHDLRCKESKDWLKSNGHQLFWMG